MSKKRKKSKKSRTLLEEVVKVFKDNPDYTYNYKQIASLLNIREPSSRKVIISMLDSLCNDGYLDQFSKGKFRLKASSIELVGTIQFISRGGAYFITDKMEEDVFIHFSRTGKALNKDIVKIRVLKFKGKPEGEVIEVVERARKEFVGTVENKGANFFLRPDDQTMHVDFYLDRKHLMGAKNGQKVKVKYLTWPSNAKSPIAAVIEILGKPGEMNVEMHAILSEFGFSPRFSKGILKETSQIKESDYNSEAQNRRDFRKILTFTIDPDDAKDFDDALSYQILKNGNKEIGVHIADVSHYITPESNLDKEAYLRGNSVYLVDRVVPMLPERLSNELCSLRPKENKLTFSAVFEIDDECNVVSEWFGKTIIYSDQRFTYDQAQEIIEGKKHIFSEAIIKLNETAKTFREKRLEKGALNIESQEVKFKLDAKGNPIDVLLKVSKEAHQLIEEYMLLANKSVAAYIGKPSKNKKIVPFVYRIHDEPKEEKISDLKVLLDQFDYQIVREKNKPISSSLNKVMLKAKKKNELHIIGPLVIRSMSKAIYTTENIGHYGLAFNYYTHFTSPIRRYADLLVHRMLHEKLQNKPYNNTGALDSQCKHISATEKQATEAERASTKYMQVLFLKDKIGQAYMGKITGLTEWGIYVELNENKCEGLVHIRSLKDDHYHYDRQMQKIIGHNSNASFYMGQEVEVEIKHTDIIKRQIDLLLVR